MTEKVSLYRFFDDGDCLLYVGVAINPLVRFSQHSESRDVTAVRHIEVEWFGSRAEALLAERFAIERERPLWNKRGVRKRRVLRETRLPIAPPETSATQRKEPEWFGPPEPYYRIGVCYPGQEPDGIDVERCIPPVSLSRMVRTIRAGDLVWVHKDINLPDQFWPSVFAAGAYRMPDTWIGGGQ